MAGTGSNQEESRDAVIGASTRVHGRIHGDGDLTLEGHVEGALALRGDLFVAPSGSIVAEVVEAVNITVQGSIEGDVRASGVVTIAAGSRVVGDVTGAGIALEEGARFAGRIDCAFDLPAELDGEPAARKPAAPAASNPAPTARRR